MGSTGREREEFTTGAAEGRIGRGEELEVQEFESLRAQEEKILAQRAQRRGPRHPYSQTEALRASGGGIREDSGATNDDGSDVIRFKVA